MTKYQARARSQLILLGRTTLWVIALFLTIGLPASGIAQSFVNLKADPVYGGIGFVRGHWATSINKMLVFLVPGQDTSVRAYDPLTNSWEFLWPSGTLGIQGRDNFASFYNPKLDELWVWNGSYLWNNPNALMSGRFHVSQRRWVATGKTDTGAFVGMVDMSATGGIMPFSGTDPAMAWAANADMGLMLGGSSETGEFTFLFEPKPGGPELYKVSRLKIPRPPWRAQCMNCMVSDGKDFYLFGGMYQEPNDPARRNRKDLWKFDTSTKTWTQLPAPPDVAYAPMLTYDSDRHALVSWVRDRLYVYNIATQQWSDQTPAGLPCLFNQLGAYSPTAKLHIYEGGNDCTSPAGDAAFYRVVGIDLAGKFQPLPPAPNPTPPPASPSTPTQSTSTSTSTGSGTFTVIPTPLPSTKFTAGDRVQVSSGPVNVRSSGSTSGATLGTQASNMTGSVVGGTVNANGFDWWNINFDTGADGWVAENFLVKSTAPTPVVAQASAVIPQTACESEGGLAGRTDILKCEPWESSVWYQNGWYRDQGDTGNSLDGRRFYRYPVDASWLANTQIVTSGCLVGSCLKVNMTDWKKKIGSYLAQSWVIPGQGGCSHSTIGCVPQQEVYMRYYMKLAPNFDPENYAFADGSAQNGGGKFPGLADATNGYQNNPSIQCGNGGEGPTSGTECWSLRLTYQTCSVTANGTRNVCQEGGNSNAKTRFGWYPYLYWNGITGGTRYSTAYWDGDGRGGLDGPCTSTYGFGGGSFGGAPGCGNGAPGLFNDKWYLVEVHVKMNTPGQANGVMEAWLDGQLRYQKTNVNFRNVGHNNLGIRQAWFDVYAGGVGVGMKEDTYVLFDQLVIATGARPGPWSAGSGVTPPPPPPVVVTPPPTGGTPQPSATLTAINLGITGEDKVGRINQTSPNGTADFHISVAGLRSTPTRIRITSDTGGIWETPFNGQNWIIATQYDGQGNGHFWFEPFTSNNFRVQVWYADGATVAADAAKQTSDVSGPPPADTALPQVTITAPVANAQVSKTTTVAISATDNVGIAKIELYKDGSLIATGTSGAFQYSWDTTRESNGFHTLIAVAFDAANNRSTATLTVNVQNTSSVGTKPSVLGQRF